MSFSNQGVPRSCPTTNAVPAPSTNYLSNAKDFSNQALRATKDLNPLMKLVTVGGGMWIAGEELLRNKGPIRSRLFDSLIVFTTFST